MAKLLDDIRAALASPDFQQFDPQKQQEIRQTYSTLIERDPDFAFRMNKVDRERLRQEILTGQAPKGIIEALGLNLPSMAEGAKKVGSTFLRRATDVTSTAGRQMEEAVSHAGKGEIPSALGKLGMSLMTAGSLPTALTVEPATELAAETVGMKPEQAKIVGDVGGLIGGFATAKAASTGKYTPLLQRILGQAPEAPRGAVRGGHTQFMIDELQRQNAQLAGAAPPLPVPRVQGLTLPFEGKTRLSHPLSPIEQVLGTEAENLLQPFMTPEMAKFGLTPETSTKILQTSINIARATGRQLNPEVPVTLQLRDIILENPDRYREFGDINQLANLMAGSKTNAGRDLALLSVAKRLFNGSVLEPLSDEAKQIADRLKALEKIDRTPTWMKTAYDYMKRVSNLWRGSLVTQLGTAVRNFEVQGVRLGLDEMVHLTEAAVQRATGKAPNPQANTLGNAFDESLDLVRLATGSGKSKELMRVLDQFPDLNASMFNLFAGDVAIRTGQIKTPGLIGHSLDGAEHVIAFANTMNRAQEFFTRATHFPLALARRMKEQGLITNLDEISQVDFRNIPHELAAQAMNDSLDVTFAKNPSSKFGQKVVELFSTPGLAQIVPFPRFMANSMRFLWEFSPAGALKLLSPREQQLIANGDFKTISKAAIGTGLLGTALMIRMSPYAGEKWHEIKLPNGTIIDTRPMAPLASYLAFAEAALVASGQTERKLGPEDLINAIGSTSFRLGSGLFMLDQVNSWVRNIKDYGSTEKLGTFGKELAGGLVSGFATPFQTVKDIVSDPRFIKMAAEIGESVGRPLNRETAMSEAGQEQRIRDIRESPFLGPSQQRIPGVSQQLPEKERPVGKSPAIREEGFQRQASGMTLRTRTVAEAEMERLGILDRQLLPPTGIPQLDRQIAKQLRPMLESVIPRLVTGTSYPQLSPEIQSEIILSLAEKIRQPLLQKSLAELPAAGLERKIRGERRTREEIIRELLGGAGVEFPHVSR